MKGVICCVCNHKGGVGKTTLSTNLGAALSLQKKKVLVIDADPQANTTGILITQETQIRNSLYELLDPTENTETPSVDSCVYLSIHHGLYCIPNVEQSSALELDFVPLFPDSCNFLKNAVRDYVKQNYDFTFIDCSPSMSLMVLNALYASDIVIVPIDASSAYSLDGLRKVLKLISDIQEKGNTNLKFLKLAINRIDKRTTISKIVIGDINERFPNYVFKTLLPIDTSFQQAEYLKKTIFTHSPTSRGAKAYRALAKEFRSLTTL